ncbi:MAG: malate synthase G, partial [Roseobacter sp.]
MAGFQKKSSLQVADALVSFVEEQALPGTGVEAPHFWKGFANLVHDFGAENKALLEKRETMQSQIDAWHVARREQPHDHEEYKSFLHEIGYLIEEGAPFAIDTGNVDPEIAMVPGPQLVVPITNARYALNAANA